MELKWKADLIDDRISHFSLSFSTQWHCSCKKFGIIHAPYYREEKYNLIKASNITTLCKFYMTKILTTRYISITGYIFLVNLKLVAALLTDQFLGNYVNLTSLDVTVLAGVCLMVTVMWPGQYWSAPIWDWFEDIAPILVVVFQDSIISQIFYKQLAFEPPISDFFRN